MSLTQVVALRIEYAVVAITELCVFSNLQYCPRVAGIIHILTFQLLVLVGREPLQRAVMLSLLGNMFVHIGLPI